MVVAVAVATLVCSRFAQLSLVDAKLEETVVVEISWPICRLLEDLVEVAEEEAVEVVMVVTLLVFVQHLKLKTSHCLSSSFDPQVVVVVVLLRDSLFYVNDSQVLVEVRF